jgi:sugar/nucleoside kinase (ribokinase family)
MKKILGIGNALVDIILFLENDDLLSTFALPKGSMQLVELNKSVEVEQSTKSLKSHMASGGSAANTIHGLARLGIETAFVGVVGKDDLGGFFKTDLENSKIHPLLAFGKAGTGRAISLVSPDGERTFATYLGAAIELTVDQVNTSAFAVYDHLHLEGYLVPNQQLVETSLEAATRNNMTISLDLASYNVVEAHIDFLERIIKDHNPVVFANEDEARAFTGLSDPQQALDQISLLCETCVVKTGKKGSLIKHKGKKYEVGVINVNCVDTTGAGDLYAAGYLYGFINDFNPQKCGEAGALLAGKVIEQPGAKINAASWDFIYQNLKIN